MEKHISNHDKANNLIQEAGERVTEGSAYLQSAEQIIDELANNNYKELAPRLIDIAKIYKKAGAISEMRKKCNDVKEYILKNISDSHYKNYYLGWLNDIILMEIDNGFINDARETLNISESILENGHNYNVGHKADIVLIKIKLGLINQEEAKGIFDELIDGIIYECIKDNKKNHDDSYFRKLRRIFAAQREAGFIHEAQKRLNEIIDIINNLATNSNDDELFNLILKLCDIGTIQNEIGLTEDSKNSYHSAIKLAIRINSPDSAANSLINISRNQVEIGGIEGIQEIFNSAVSSIITKYTSTSAVSPTTTRYVSEDSFDLMSSSLLFIARYQAEGGHIDDAKATQQNIKNKQSKLYIDSVIASWFAKKGQIQEALNIIDISFNRGNVNGILLSYCGDIYQDIIDALLKNEELQEAINITKRAKLDFIDKSNILLKIALAYNKKGLFNEARDYIFSVRQSLPSYSETQSSAEENLARATSLALAKIGLLRDAKALLENYFQRSHMIQYYLSLLAKEEVKIGLKKIDKLNNGTK